MDKQEVYVITNVESGWDCVRGVYLDKKDAIAYCAEMDDKTPEEWDESDSTYIIHTQYLN